jgi:hypothetical protein
MLQIASQPNGLPFSPVFLALGAGQTSTIANNKLESYKLDQTNVMMGGSFGADSGFGTGLDSRGVKRIEGS